MQFLRSNKSFCAYLFILISTTADATLPIWGKFALDNQLSPLIIMLLRNLFTFMILLLFSFIYKFSILCRSPIVWIQSVFLLADELFFYFSLKDLSASIAIVIFYTFPVIVTLLSMLVFKEKKSLFFFLGLGLAILGVSLISGIYGGGLHISVRGLILAFMASLCFAVFSIIGQISLADHSPLQLTGTFSLLGTIIFSIVLLPNSAELISLNLNQISIGLGIAIFNNLLGMIFFMKAINLIGSAQASLACTIEPVISIILAVLFLGESFNIIQSLGTFFIVLSIFLSLTGKENFSQQKFIQSS